MNAPMQEHPLPRETVSPSPSSVPQDTPAEGEPTPAGGKKGPRLKRLMQGQNGGFTVAMRTVSDFDSVALAARDTHAVPLIADRSTYVNKPEGFGKRRLDLTLSLLALALLWPFFFVFAALIRLDSKGPVLFRQTRVGERGREFTIYKFRTMHADSPVYMDSPRSPKDPRITRVGRFLRRTSLDELPQLFNVIRGDMSLVGPRPEMPFLVAGYNDRQRERLSVKPGITGLWQISADRERPIHQNLSYDIYYIRNRSLMLDLAILVRTVLFALASSRTC